MYLSNALLSQVIVIIPEIPCFPGDLKASAGTLLIIGAQYRSLCRGKDSIFGKIEAAGYNPRDYITLFNLRQWDRSEGFQVFCRTGQTWEGEADSLFAVKYDPDVIHKMEQDSGVLWGQVLAAMARVNIGDNPPELEKDNNATLRFKPMKVSQRFFPRRLVCLAVPGTTISCFLDRSTPCSTATQSTRPNRARTRRERLTSRRSTCLRQ